MDKIDLKNMWTEAHAKIQENIYDDVTFSKTLKMNHSKIITKVLSDLKLKIVGYSLLLLIFIGLMIYALAYLGIHLSANTLVLFSFIGIFFLIRIASGINRLLVLTKTSNNLSVKESICFFRKKLIRIKTVDFLSYLFYFYTLAMWSICSYIKDIGGFKHIFFGDAFQTLLMIIIIILLSIPWLIKYQHNRRYRKLYSNLNNSSNFLEDVT